MVTRCILAVFDWCVTSSPKWQQCAVPHAIPAFESTPECMDLCSVTVRLLAHKNKSENGTMYI